MLGASEVLEAAAWGDVPGDGVAVSASGDEGEFSVDGRRGEDVDGVGGLALGGVDVHGVGPVGVAGEVAGGDV